MLLANVFNPFRLVLGRMTFATITALSLLGEVPTSFAH